MKYDIIYRLCSNGEKGTKTMFKKLDFILEKYEELSMKGSDRDVIANK